MKIGLFFGSFNPIHIGHLVIANSIAEHSGFKQIWFVVSPQNPLKKPGSLLHEFDRYDMVRLAIADNPRFDVSDVEFHMPKPSYTIDTLAYLGDKYPKHDFRVIMGEDNLINLRKWKNADQLLDNWGLLVYPRPGSDSSTQSDHPHIEIVQAPMMDISATYIRTQVKKGKSIQYLVHPDVETLIRSKGFYS